MSVEKIKAYSSSTVGKESIRNFIETQNFKQNVLKPKWINKIKEKIEKIEEHGADVVIEYLINKYSSNYYLERELRCKREPQETLLYYLLYYARKHCTESLNDRSYTIFVAESYYIGSYIIRLIIGQGSFIDLTKIKNLNYD